MKIIDYELTCDISHIYENKIFIYGTGVYGNKVAAVFSQMEIAIDGFCETNPNRNEFLNRKVLSAKTLIDDYDKSDVLVIIASERYYNEMLFELQKTENMFICTYYALFMSLFLNCKTEKITESLKKNIEFFKELGLEMSIQSFLNSWWTTENYSKLLSQKSLVWLYQPGKVASQTIYQSNTLKTQHFHSLACGFNADSGLVNVYRHILAEIKKIQLKLLQVYESQFREIFQRFFMVVM